jgi:hypothetical protein
VLLFDWRGCGLNGPNRGLRLFDDDDEFWDESFNSKYAPRSATRQGLDYKTFSTRYRDFLLNDLAAARFFLDKQNDDQKCNTNRIWLVSEGQGAHLGLAFIASESFRYSIFKKNNLAEIQEPRNAVKDYAGLVALSYAGYNPTAGAVLRTSLVNKGHSVAGQEGKTHLANRLAMVMIYGKKEGASASRAALGQFIRGSEMQLKQHFKYTKELDTSKAEKSVSGAELLTEVDTFGARDYLIRALVEISKDKQDFGKERTKRNVAEMTTVPRFPIETYKPN